MMIKARNYLEIADQLIIDVKEGVLKPGDQLPPQREFAYTENIAPSTASRVYAELVKRGIAIGEVGRGTFIRTFDHMAPELGEPAKQPINMQLNFSVMDGMADHMIPGMEHLLRPDVLGASLMPVSAEGDAAGRATAAKLLRFDDWEPDPDNIVFTGGGRQGIGAAMAAVAALGDRIAIEYMTYPVVKGIAARLGITLVPIPMDGEGLCVETLAHEHRKVPLRAIYIQPTLHNPLGTTMSEARRQALANYVRAENLYVIEDVVYAFLGCGVPFGKLAPNHTFTVESLSKRLTPGLNFGFIVGPPSYKEKLIAAIRTGGWITSGLSYSTCMRWLSDGTVKKYEILRREQAAERQIVACKILSGFTLHTDPTSYHIWMELNDGWRAEAFCAAAASRGVAISPASVFAVSHGSAPNCIRIALAPPTDDDLRRGLNVIKSLALSNENEIIIE